MALTDVYGRWISRTMMFTMTVVMPFALALGTAPNDDAQSWVAFVVPVVAVSAAILGLGYTLRRWRRPPNWARAMAKLSDQEDDDTSR